MDKRNKKKPKFKIHNLVGTADMKKTFSKGDTTNWSNKLYKVTEIIIDTLPSYPELTKEIAWRATTALRSL